MSSKKRYVDRFVGLTPKKGEILEDKYRKILEIFSEHEFERILDVGCGDGNFSMLMGGACKARDDASFIMRENALLRIPFEMMRLKEPCKN